MCCSCAYTLLRFGYLTYKLAFLRYVTGQGKISVHQLTGFSEPAFPSVTWDNGYFTVLMNILYISTYSSDCIKMSPITGVFDRPLPLRGYKRTNWGNGGILITERDWKIFTKTAPLSTNPSRTAPEVNPALPWTVSVLASSPQHDRTCSLWTQTFTNVLGYLGFLSLKMFVWTSRSHHISSVIPDNHCDDGVCGFYYGQLQLQIFCQPSESAVARPSWF